MGRASQDFQISYAFGDYLTCAFADLKKVYFAYVREKLMGGGFTPGEALNLELTGNKDGRRFQKGVPYDLDAVNLYASFDMPVPTQQRSVRRR